jgi:short-chain Z-isoprenyl diphosphate synthase
MIRTALYYLYERQLASQVLRGPTPAHIGIILDGNRRYGQRYGLNDPKEIYRLGALKLDEVLDWCAELAVSAVTLWVLSTENFSRPAQQVSAIIEAIEAKMRALATDPQIHRRRVRVQAIGRLELLPATTVAAIDAARQATASYDGIILTIAVAYGGRVEIADAVRSLLAEEARRGAALSEAIEHVTPEAIGRHLYTAAIPDPDLIIRTSGEVRLSGFLLWQSAFSEFYFCDAYWPVFRRIDFLRAVRAYQQRQRRWGA